MTLLLKQTTVIANFTSKHARQEAQFFMASTRTEVIRIVLDSEESERLSVLVNALAALGTAFLHREDADGMCFDLIPPTQDQGAIRASCLIIRETMHFNAVVAPAWKDGSHYKED
jgi:hypothetical protein